MSKENKLERIIPVEAKAEVYREGVRLTIPLEYSPEKVINDIAPKIHKIYGYGALDINYFEGKTIVDYFPLKKEEERVGMLEGLREVGRQLCRTPGCIKDDSRNTSNSKK
jgi:hypothetical protein